MKEKTFDLMRMLKEQEELDNKFKEKKGEHKEYSVEDNLLAVLTELGETSQSGKKFWCYWKNNIEFNKNDFLEELSDYLHFFLSLINNIGDVNDIITFNKSFTPEQFNIFLEGKKVSRTMSLLNLFKFNFDEYLIYPIGICFIMEKFVYITNLLNEIDSNWEEFLEIHYKKYEKNTNERTKEDY